jgi:hypothetical protein
MTASTAHIDTDTWTLRTLREAKAYRDSIGEPDAYWDARLAASEAAVREVGTVTERPTEDVQDTLRRGDAVASGARGSSFGTRNAASEAQLRFIASLSRTLGYELQTPRDKGHASLIIEGAKNAVDAARKSGTVAAAPARPATEGQVSYLTDLLATRVHGHGDLDAAALTFDRASALITELRDAPRAGKATAAHGIAEGRYAYQPEGAQAIFLRVSRTGRVYTQAGPAEHPYRGQDTDALHWIKENQRDAAALYGRLLGVCGMCGRELTDEESRARGLGPICAAK